MPKVVHQVDMGKPDGKVCGEVKASNRKCVTTEDGVIVRKIFISNIHAKTSVEQLTKVFVQFGDISNVFLKNINIATKNPTYAFITFKNSEAAYNALSKNLELSLFKKKLNINPADTWHQPDCQTNKEDSKPESPLHENDNYKVTLNTNGNLSKEIPSGSKETPSTNIPSVFNVINDDCIIHIFSYLNGTEKVIMEEVCKRWKCILLNMWERVHKFDLEEIISEKKIVTANNLRNILIRCKDNLNELYLKSENHQMNVRIHQVIGKYCPNISILDLSGTTTNVKAILALASLNKLKELTFKDLSNAKDNVMSILLSRNANLELLIINRSTAITGMCLSHLTIRLKVLQLNQCNNLQLEHLKQSFKKIPNLSSLSLSTCATLTSSFLVEVVNSFPDLAQLSLDNFYPILTSDSLRNITNLVNLKKLSLCTNSALGDVVLKYIATSHLSIESLDISATNLTAASLDSLKSFPKLTELSMSYLMGVNEEIIESISKKGLLKGLVIRGCTNVSNECIRLLVKNCPELMCLDISGCRSVSNSVLPDVIALLDLQSNKRSSLILIIGGTDIHMNWDEWTGHDLLKINTENNCVEHYRQDFYDNYFHYPDESEDSDDSDFNPSSNEDFDNEIYRDDDHYAVHLFYDDEENNSDDDFDEI